MFHRLLSLLPWVVARREDLDALRRETQSLRARLIVAQARETVALAALRRR